MFPPEDHQEAHRMHGTTLTDPGAELERLLGLLQHVAESDQVPLTFTEADALDVIDRTVGSVESLLDTHRRLIHDQLLAEAERYTKGAFVDGIRHAAAAVLQPPAAIAPEPEALGLVDAVIGAALVEANAPVLAEPRNDTHDTPTPSTTPSTTAPEEIS